jgi:hypothetical protein
MHHCKPFTGALEYYATSSLASFVACSLVTCKGYLSLSPLRSLTSLRMHHCAALTDSDLHVITTLAALVSLEPGTCQ